MLTEAVLKLDLLLRRKSTAFAVCLGCPIRPNAVVARKAFRASLSPTVSAAATTPLHLTQYHPQEPWTMCTHGATAFTWIPDLPVSLATVLVRPITPHLLTTYGEQFGGLYCPAVLAALTMDSEPSMA